MTTTKSGEFGVGWWGKNLDDVDREVARLASICGVRILDPGVVERVLKNDDSVCGSRNPVAFGKLRNALMMHYTVRDKTVAAIGELQTEVLVKQVVERIQERLGGRLGRPEGG